MPVKTPAPGDLEPIERASRDELQSLQLQRLRQTLEQAYAHVPHYRATFDARGVHPSDCKTLADLAKFPFTTKKDLRDNYPFGMFAVPREQVVRVHASSGTTGKPTVVGYTKKDIDTWADLVARSIRAAGGRAGDIVQVAYGYGLFTGGLGAHYGAETVLLMRLLVAQHTRLQASQRVEQGERRNFAARQHEIPQTQVEADMAVEKALIDTLIPTTQQHRARSHGQLSNEVLVQPLAGRCEVDHDRRGAATIAQRGRQGALQGLGKQDHARTASERSIVDALVAALAEITQWPKAHVDLLRLEGSMRDPEFQMRRKEFREERDDVQPHQKSSPQSTRINRASRSTWSM